MKSVNCWTPRFEALCAKLEADLDAKYEEIERLERELEAVKMEIGYAPSPAMIRWLRANEKASVGFCA